MVEVFHATRYEQPPALTGSPAVAAVDRVIRRALAKRPDERPASADILADELRAVRGLESTSAPAVAHPLTRLVVLPFRILRPDSETDFLAFSLPDAITTSLTGIGSLVLRSSAVAGRFGGNTPDLRALAAEADVDRVVMGTLLRAGAELRVSAQLVDAPSGTVLASHTVQSSLGDLFRLQDDIARRVADALALPLTGGPSLTPRDTPHDARAYELYLRGNELARTYDGLSAARELYQQCDRSRPAASPRHGRGWDAATASSASTSTARPTAKPAPRRPSAARSRSTRATRWRTSSTPTSKRTSAKRLARWSGCSAKPRVMATIRSCSPGWSTPAATAASTSNPSPRIHEARRLDPNVPTSLDQTLLVSGELDRLLAIEPPRGRRRRRRRHPGDWAGAGGPARRGAAAADRHAPARHGSRRSRCGWTTCQPGWITGSRTWPAGDGRFERLKIQDDPEAIFQEGWLLCDVGEHARGLGVPAAGRGQGLLPGGDACQPFAVRPAARRPGVHGAAGGSRRGTSARAGGFPRGRRRAPARIVDTDTRLRQSHDELSGTGRSWSSAFKYMLVAQNQCRSDVQLTSRSARPGSLVRARRRPG